MLKKIILCTVCSFCLFTTQAQLTIDAELRPRAEYRHGYRSIFPENVDPAFLVSQRTRLNTLYKIKKLEFYVSFQNVRIWGDVPQLNSKDQNGVAIQQAWAKLFFNSNFSLTLGRQEIVYDDKRLYGNSNWAQQGRVHDAAVLTYTKGDLDIDLNLAYNQSENGLTETTLLTPNTYKSLQLLRVYKTLNHFTASLTFMNLGNQFIDEENSENNTTFFSKTIGGYFTYTKNKFSFKANVFGQFGKDNLNNNLNAYYYALGSTWKPNNDTRINIGFEKSSGNNDGFAANGKNKAFTPFFGNNHLHGGFMDYFFVGNHLNSIGLLDVYASGTYDFSDRFKLYGNIHNFSGDAQLDAMDSKQLGVEVDVVATYKPFKDVTVNLGYSHMFANDNLKILKTTNSDKTNNFIWAMVTIQPTLFKQ